MSRPGTGAVVASLLALAIAIAAAACERAEAPLDLGASRVAPPASIDPRTALDLARALDRVERADPDDADDGYRAVVASFEGRRFSWRLHLVEPLCRVERCNVLAFDGGDRAEVGQSWMPRLELSPAQRDALLEQCRGRSPCPVAVTGRLARLVASTERFTSVTLDQIELARAD